MPGPAGRGLQKSLQRDSLETNWGFRIQGGTYLNAAIIVQKVIRDTPADGVLHPGDVLLEIQSNDSSNLTQVEAQEIVKMAGLSLQLFISRSGKDALIKSPFLQTSSPSSRQKTKKIVRGPMNFDFGTDYNPPKWSPAESSSPLLDYKPPTGFMLSKLKDTLKNPGRCQSSLSNNLKGDIPPWSTLATPSALPSQFTVSNSPGLNYNQNPNSSVPAWKGSLPSSEEHVSSDKHIGPPFPHTPRIQSVHYGAGEKPEYRQLPSEGVLSDTARAVQLQYNNPVGLYSKTSAESAMKQQLSGRSGGGEISVKSETEVQKMIRDEEQQRRRAKRHLASYNSSSYTGLSSQRVRQSPSVRALESKFVVDEVGMSDF